MLLSRNPKKFILNFPEIASNKALKIIKGDIRNFKYPKGQVDYVFHAATINFFYIFYFIKCWCYYSNFHFISKIIALLKLTVFFNLRYFLAKFVDGI